MSPLEIRPEALLDYVDAHSTPPAQHLEALEEETRAKLAVPQMLSGAVEGRFLEFLVWIAQPQLILEIGTYSGYSALSMAGALPADARIVSLEVSEEHSSFARRHIEAAGESERIEVIQGDAHESLARLDGPFDLVFIDADKTSYADYYDAVLPKLAPRGFIVIDNTLWSGDVLDPDDDNAAALAELNARIAADDRVVAVMLTVRDGITLVRPR